MSERLVTSEQGYDHTLTCWSYTHARRHPSVLGKVGGAHLPFGPYTPTQGVVFLLVGATMFLTKQWWGLAVGGSLRVALMFGVPAAAMFVFRNLRIEGRSPLFFLFGVIGLICSPRHGYLRGRRARRPRPEWLFGHTIGQSSREVYSS